MTTSSSNSPASSKESASEKLKPADHSLDADRSSDETPGFDNLPPSRLIFDQAEIARATDVLAVQINAELYQHNPVFLSVLHGGLPFTADLLMRFQGPCDLGYVHVGRYGAQTTGGELTWHMEPTVDLRNRVVLFVDDVLDKGETLAALRERALALGAADVRAAVLVRKAVANCVSHADYVALDAPDLFLFGYGMDIDGQLRNLPQIRAVIDT